MLCRQFSLGCWHFHLLQNVGRTLSAQFAWHNDLAARLGRGRTHHPGRDWFYDRPKLFKFFLCPKHTLFFAKFYGTRVPGHLDYFQHHRRAGYHPKSDCDGQFRRFRPFQRRICRARTAATVGATTFAGAGGGAAGITGAIAAGAVATTAAAESLVVASINGSGGSSLIGSLAQMNRGRDREGDN